jgi:hypothetical protein
MDQVTPDSQVKHLCCPEVGMTGKLHHVIFTHAFVKPVADSLPGLFEAQQAIWIFRMSRRCRWLRTIR